MIPVWWIGPLIGFGFMLGVVYGYLRAKRIMKETVDRYWNDHAGGQS